MSYPEQIRPPHTRWCIATEPVIALPQQAKLNNKDIERPSAGRLVEKVKPVFISAIGQKAATAGNTSDTVNCTFSSAFVSMESINAASLSSSTFGQSCGKAQVDRKVEEWMEPSTYPELELGTHVAKK